MVKQSSTAAAELNMATSMTSGQNERGNRLWKLNLHKNKKLFKVNQLIFLS